MSSNERDEQAPTSPYGPAGGEQNDLERAFGDHAHDAADSAVSVAQGSVVDPPAAPLPTEEYPDWVHRGRHVLRVAALVCGLLALALIVVLVVLALLGESLLATSLPSVAYDVVWMLTLASPVLAVVALNLVVWRALLRPIARLPRGGAIALIIGVVLALAVVSVLLVFVLLLAGFLASSALSW